MFIIDYCMVCWALTDQFQIEKLLDLGNLFLDISNKLTSKNKITDFDKQRFHR